MKIRFVIAHMPSTAKRVCLGQVVTVVLGQVVTFVLGQVVTVVFGASCYNCNNARAVRTDGSVSELSADND